MTEDELFALVLRELWRLLRTLGPLGDKAVLIGGQVLAVEGLRRSGSAIIEATTETGITVARGFSFEPDLLIDLDADRFMADRLPELLRSEGYERVRDYRWAKPLEGGISQRIELDLFRAPDLPDSGEPTPMTALPDAELVQRRCVPVELTLAGEQIQLLIPDAIAFLRMKLRAKLEQRPTGTKDCFDLYAYVQLHGVESISATLGQAGTEGRAILSGLKTLFWSTDSAGVKDVLASVIGLGTEEENLLAQAVVDLFADL